MRFTFIEADLRASLQIGIEQPLHHKQGAFDVAYFLQCNGQFMLAGIRCKLAEKLAWRDCARSCGGSQTQNIRPIVSN